MAIITTVTWPNNNTMFRTPVVGEQPPEGYYLNEIRNLWFQIEPVTVREEIDQQEYLVHYSVNSDGSIIICRSNWLTEEAAQQWIDYCIQDGGINVSLVINEDPTPPMGDNEWDPITLTNTPDSEEPAPEEPV
jgi:hypothetical protein